MSSKTTPPKNKKAAPKTNTNTSQFTDEQLEAFASDLSAGAVGSILREVGALHLNVKHLKRQNLRFLASNIALGATLFFVFGTVIHAYPKHKYIPTTNNAAICEVATETNPRVTPATLTEFAKDAVLNVYSYDYVNYRENLNTATNRWFTDEGRRQFMASLDASGNLERVLKGRLILRSMAINTPQLDEEGRKVSGVRYWVVHVPTAIEFFSGGEQTPRTRQDFLAIVTIVQTPASATNLKGISVDSIQLAPYIGRGR